MSSMDSPFGPSPLQKLEQAAPKQKPQPTQLRRSRTVVPPAAPEKPSKPVAPYKTPAPSSGPPINSLVKTKNYFGSINDVNARTQAVHDAYTQAYGKPPSPGLTLDVVASPVPTQHFNSLFSVPLDPFAAKNRGIVNQNAPQDTLVVRHDGYVQQSNPVAERLIANEGFVTPNVSQPAQPSKTLAQYHSLQGQHPWVAMGMLPIDSNLLGGFWSAVQYAQDHPQEAAPLTVGGQTLAQYQKQNKIGEALTGSQVGTPGLYSMSLAPGGKTTTTPQAIKTQQTRETIAAGATTVKQAQDQLKQVAPDFFQGLPSTGFVNSDWAKAIGKYQTSRLYFQQQTAKLAEDNGFGSNKNAFVHAWKAKQAAIKSQPFLRSLIEHQPLAFFDYRTHGKAILNLLDGNTKGWGWANVPTVFLSSLVHTAGVALNEIAGTVDTAKQDSAFVSAYMQSILPKNTQKVLGATVFGDLPMLQGKGMTEKQARDRALKALNASPNILRVVDPNYTGKGGQRIAGLIADNAFNLLLGAPKFTGEKILAGDMAAFDASPYAANKTLFAFNALRQGKLGEAVASLEGGRGAENLAVAAEDAVKNGEMPYSQFKLHANELYTQGATKVGEAEVAGPLLRSLRTRDLNTPGRPGMAVQEVRAKVRALTDQFENTMRARSSSGFTNHAVDYIKNIRQSVARAAPGAEKRAIFDTRTPEDVYNWARVHLNASPAEAEKWRDQLIRLRASEDIQGISALNEAMRARYMEAHPGSSLPANPIESTGPEIESESRTYLHFPAALETRAQSINSHLNDLGRIHRQTIVSGSPVFGVPIPGFGESLAWKHAIADTTRRIIGGGGFLTADKAGRRIVDDFLKDNPAAIREVGTARDSAIMGENRYITGQKPTDPLSFNTGDTKIELKGKVVPRKAALKAAGGYLRRNLSSDALKAYLASTPDDLTPLVNMISKSHDWRAILKAATPEDVQAGAQVLFDRYLELENAGKMAGLQDPLNEALDVLIKNKGPKADVALGKWIDENQINLPVREGMIEKSSYDDLMQWWIGKLMTANKWNRGKLFDHVFYGTVKDLESAGWDVKNAIPVAADLAKAQTVYHMLDFSNMLQVEQNLRWLSYFATKHRLYWTWILKQAVRRPGLAAAVDGVRQHLDKYGRLDFSLFGHSLYIPAARLFWVNAREYPQTSPIVQFLAEGAKGIASGEGAVSAFNTAYGSLTSTSGNLFTRDDQAEMYAIKLALVATGKMKANGDAITVGMTSDQKKMFDEQVNEYSSFYYAEHHTWPSEQDAVKHVLWAQTAYSWWNSNLFLPAQPSTARSSKLTNLLNQYGQILNPAKKRAFLDKHPEVALQFGVSQDPTVYLHNNQLWDKFNAAYAQVKQGRAAIMQDILKNGFTPQTELRMKALSAKWTKTIDNLKLEDAATWAGTTDFPKGKISDGQVVTPGPWTIQLEGDPLASRAFIHQSFPDIPAGQLNSHTVGQRIVDLQDRAAQIRRLKTDVQAQQWGYPSLESAKTELSTIENQIAPFFSYPTSAPSKLQSEYYSKFVSPYIQERQKLQAAVTAASADNKDQAESALRAWKDSHDHPVFITYNGQKIKFPSVVQIGYATMPKAQLHQALQGAASGDWAHIASYEKTMLGIKTPADVGQGWSEYYKAVTAYNKDPKNSSLVQSQKVALAKQINKYYPGFFKDFLFAQQPKIDRFKYTTLYRGMPDKAMFDQVIGNPAVAVAKAIKQNGSSTYYLRYWRQYVEEKVQPWLDSHPELKSELTGYGPNFLNTLPSVSKS